MDLGSVAYDAVFANVDVATYTQCANHRASVDINIVADVHLLVRQLALFLFGRRPDQNVLLEDHKLAHIYCCQISAYEHPLLDHSLALNSYVGCAPKDSVFADFVALTCEYIGGRDVLNWVRLHSYI